MDKLNKSLDNPYADGEIIRMCIIKLPLKYQQSFAEKGNEKVSKFKGTLRESEFSLLKQKLSGNVRRKKKARKGHIMTMEIQISQMTTNRTLNRKTMADKTVTIPHNRVSNLTVMKGSHLAGVIFQGTIMGLIVLGIIMVRITINHIIIMEMNFTLHKTTMVMDFIHNRETIAQWF